MKLEEEVDVIIDERLHKLLPTILTHLECHDIGKISELKEAIRIICLDFVKNRKIVSDAPSTAEAKKKLTEIKRHAQALYGLTNPENTVSRVALSLSEVRKFPDITHGRLLNYESNDQDSITLEMILNPQFDGFHKYLYELAVACKKAKKELTQTTSHDGEKLYVVNPKLEFVKQCIILAEWAQPGKVSSTVGGFLSKLVSLTYEVATGEIDKELETPVKRAVAAWKTTNQFDDVKKWLAEIHKMDIGS